MVKVGSEIGGALLGKEGGGMRKKGFDGLVVLGTKYMYRKVVKGWGRV